MSKIPRRIDINRYWPAEQAIREAIQEIEKMGCDTKLTDAVVLLGQAKDKVADFIDEQIEKEAKKQFMNEEQLNG